MGLIEDAEKLAELLEKQGPLTVDGRQVILLEVAAAREIALRLRTGATAQKRVRFIPRGADEALPPLPGAEQISEADVRKAIQSWDKAVPEEFVGLLDATEAE
jgi:hypothetical protein